jgi:hypothetical protein
MKKVNEANMNISVNGDSAAEVSELLRIMQLAGTGAKEVGADDINQKMLPSPDSDSGSCEVCGGDHGPSDLMAGCGGKSPSETMGDTIRMISAGEEAYEEVDDGGFGSATTEPNELPGDVSDMIPAGNDLHKEKGSYPATAGGDNPMNTKESIHAMLAKRLAEKQAGSKPDFPDLDKDGDTEEPMSQAIAQRDGKEEDEEVAERDIESNFENKHKDINNLGRKMIAMSSKMSGTDDTSLMMSNALSRLGEVLAEFGGNGFAANNMNDVIKKSSLNKEIVQMLMKKAKTS